MLFPSSPYSKLCCRLVCCFSCAQNIHADFCCYILEIKRVHLSWFSDFFLVSQLFHRRSTSLIPFSTIVFFLLKMSLLKNNICYCYLLFDSYYIYIKFGIVFMVSIIWLELSLNYTSNQTIHSCGVFTCIASFYFYSCVLRIGKFVWDSSISVQLFD